MKLKRLLTYGILLAATLSVNTMNAELQTISVDGNPLFLDYDKGDITGNFLNSEGSTGSSITYNLQVEKSGTYLLYLQTGNKLNSGQLHQYDVEINNKLETSYILDFMLGGNWNNFVIMPQEINLPSGEVTLKITQTGERCYIHSKNAPYLIPASFVNEIGNNEISIDVMHPDPSSTLNFTSAAAFGVDNSGYGDNNSVLITSDDKSASNGTKSQASYPKTKLRYIANVAQEGDYMVDVEGTFYSKPGNDVVSTTISDFPLNVKAVWKGNTYLTEDIITNFTESDNNKSKASGKIHLKKGVYFIELSTDQDGKELFFLSDLKFSKPTEVVEDATPEGMHVPAVAFDEIEDAFFGHNFIISGQITLDQIGDTFESATISFDENDQENITVDNSALTFSYEVAAEKIKEEGEHTFTVVAIAKNNDTKYKGNAEVKVNLQKKVFEITATADGNGTITFSDNNQVKEGDNISVTITPNEGYEIATVKVDEKDVTINPGANGVATYTFENVTENHSIEVSFSLKVYSVTIEDVENGTITTDAKDNKVEHGSSLNITVTPKIGYKIATISVDNTPVEFTPNSEGVASYTIQKVEADVTVSATFELKKYTVTTSVVGNGTVKVEASEDSQAVSTLAESQEFEHGTKIVITATPGEGQKIKSITINGEALTGVIETGHSHTINSIEADHEIAVTFEEDKSTGIYSVGAEGISYSVVNDGILVRTNEEANVMLIDLSGRMLYQGSVNGEIHIATGAKGVNVLKVSTANSSISVKVVL